MAVIAFGAEKVKQLEYALGGKRPARSSKEPRARLQKFVEQHSRNQKATRVRNARLTGKVRDRVLGAVISKDDPALKRNVEDARKAFQLRLKRKIRKPRIEKIEPRFISGSGFWLKAPPYDDDWATGAGNVSADKVAGNYDMAIQSFGDGYMEDAAGVAVWFFCTADDPMQRVAALYNYSDDWWDSAFGYVAHNDLRTRIWVWGDTEQDWVVRSEEFPSWSDGVGWFDSHGNDPDGDAGTISIQTFFPARANRWYEAWIWSDASIYADGGVFGFAASSIHFSAHVPFVVFGSLF
jgi:hypothetical protein